jgi:hypothetical protein
VAKKAPAKKKAAAKKSAGKKEKVGKEEDASKEEKAGKEEISEGEEETLTPGERRDCSSGEHDRPTAGMTCRRHTLNETSIKPAIYGERFVKRRGLFCMTVASRYGVVSSCVSRQGHDRSAVHQLD